MYIVNGAELIAITSTEINNYLPKVGDGFELIVRGLCIYPVNY